MPSNEIPTPATVQLFNEAVLGSSLTDAIPMLLPRGETSWSPKQVVLDYKGGACYGAMIHYDRSQSFELLRQAINCRFREHEHPAFAGDSTMGIWRMEEAGFTIQLSDAEDEASFMAIYVLFIDPLTMASKIEELYETKPELFLEFPVEEFNEALREGDSAGSESQDGE